jgi:hydroxymethylpyrimidine pyrophosphatase-like HAD family hydrolase
MYGINRYEASLFSGEVFPIKNAHDFLTKYQGAIITKITLEGFVNDGERLVLEDSFHLNPLVGYSEGIIKGENKSHGMEVILKQAGIAWEDSIAIGDSVNDIGMVRSAGLGIAMGNACNELKQIAKKITGECGRGGVGSALRQWVIDP